MPVRLPLGAAALLLLVLAVLPAHAEVSPPLGQLPDQVRPLHYRLDLEVDPDRESFAGRAEIDLLLEETLPSFWMHGRGLAVFGAQILLPDSRRIAATYEEIEESGVVRLTAAEPIGPGPATLILDYDAPFNGSLEGLFRVEEAGESYAFTHLEPIRARQVFPGFDEPRFKTPYDISVTIRADDEAISNAPIVESLPLAEGRRLVRFATTEPLPSYLVALAIGPLDIVAWEPIPPSPQRARPLPLRAAAAKGRGEELHYALEHTAAMLAILEDYFDLAYPYAKLDLVAVPAFGPGGMENAGAIFYREDLLLLDQEPSIYQKRGYAYVHAHELAHMWFGDYVTPAWWNDLWLNEAFATWMSDRVVSRWQPEAFDDRGPLRSAARAMWNDRLPSAPAVRQPIASNHDISNAFDRITYNKGGGVLAMFERYLGEEVFRDGVRRYIRRFPHGVATAEDFMAALAEAAEDSSLVPAQRSFLEQSGIPLVHLDWDCRAEGVAVSLRQERFQAAGLDPAPERQWRLPLCLAYQAPQGRERHCLILAEPEASLTLPLSYCPAWMLPGEAGAGYFLWSLPRSGWESLTAAFGTLAAGEQLALMTSASGAYRAGSLDIEPLLALAREAARSEAWDVVEAPMQVLRDIKNFVLPTDRQAEIKEHFQEIFRPALARFDLSERLFAEGAASSEEALLLGDLLWFLALDAEDPDLRSRLAPLGRAFLGYGGDGTLHPELLHADFQRLALVVAAQEEGLPFIEALIDRFQGTRDQDLSGTITAVLGYLTEPEAVARVQALVLDPETPQRDASRLLYRQSRRVLNREAVFAFLREREEEILARIPTSHLGGLPWLTSGFCSAEDIAAIEAFFAPKVADWQGAPRALQQSLDEVRVCAALAEAQREAALSYLGRSNHSFE